MMADSSLNMYTGPTSEQKPEKKKKKKPDLPVVSIKNAADYQRMKLDRLFANPEKPVVIPVRPKDKNLPPPPEFVRNVMGSSAGAGSGEFHVYRHLRRKEYARQKTIQEKAKFENLDDEFQRKLEENRKMAELKTAKKRAKRLKKKQNLKKKAKGNDGKEKGASSGKTGNTDSSSNDSNSSDESEDEKDASKTEEKLPAGQKKGSSNAEATQSTSFSNKNDSNNATVTQKGPNESESDD